LDAGTATTVVCRDAAPWLFAGDPNFKRKRGADCTVVLLQWNEYFVAYFLLGAFWESLN
jgi:hypothetical protein